MKGENGGIIMGASEKLGFTREKFDELYDTCNGFDNDVNKNSPVYEEQETFEAFLEAGSEKILECDRNLADKIMKAC